MFSIALTGAFPRSSDEVPILADPRKDGSRRGETTSKKTSGISP